MVPNPEEERILEKPRDKQGWRELVFGWAHYGIKALVCQGKGPILAFSLTFPVVFATQIEQLGPFGPVYLLIQGNRQPLAMRHNFNKREFDAAKKEPSLWANYIGFFVVATLVFLIYIPTLSFEFTNWDDPVYVLTNRAIQTPGLSGVKEILTRAIPASHGDYIPVTVLSYWVDYQLWGFGPTGYHLSNLLLHVIGSGLMFLLLRRLTMRPVTSMVVTFLFALHPVNTEAVTWIAERKSVMAMLWMLLSFHAFLSYRQKLKTYKIHFCLSVFFYILACLSKTAVVFFPLLLMAYEVLLSRAGLLQSLLRLIPFFLISVFTAAGRILGHYASGQMDWSPFETFWSHVLTVFEIFGNYIKSLILPINLNNSYPLEPSASLFDSGVLFGLLSLVVMIVLVVRYFRPYPLFCFGLVWYMVAWLPHSQIIPVPPALQGDRYVYYSSIGLFLALVLGVEQLAMKAGHKLSSKGIQYTICTFFSLVIGVFAFMTVTRNPVWSDSISLWSDSVVKYALNPMAHCNLAMAYAEKGRIDEAIEEYKEALSINDKNADAHNNLAGLYVRKDRLDEAIFEYKRALAINGGLRQAHTNLGTVYAMKGRLDDAISEFEAAVAINPNHATSRYYLGLAYSKKGRLKEAVSQYKKALNINPGIVAAYVRLGTLFETQGKLRDAIGEYDKAIRVKPNYYRAYICLAHIYASASDDTIRNTKQAVTLATRACRLTGFRNLEALETLAFTLREQGDLKGAAEIEKRAMRLKGTKR